MSKDLFSTNFLYDALLNNSPFGIFNYSTDGVIFTFNQQLIDVLGSSKEKLINFNMLENLTNKHMLKAIRKSLEDGFGEFYGEYTSITGQKTSFMRALFFSAKDSSGKTIGGVGFFEDLSVLEQTKNELYKNRNILESLMYSLPDLVWAKDLQGNYLTCNKRFEGLIGLNKNKIIKHNDYDFFNKNLADFFREHDKLALLKGKANTNEELLTFADGHKELCETIKSPMYDADNQLLGILGIARDITQRRKLEEQISLTQFSIDNANVAITWLDAKSGEIFFVNKAACDSLGYTFEELTQLKIIDIDPNFDESIWDKYAHNLLLIGENRFETLHKRKDGTTFPVEIIAKILTFKDKIYNVAFAIDISLRKTLEKRLLTTQYCVDQSTLGIFWTNKEGKIVYANQSACSSLGYNDNEITTLHISDVDPLTSKEAWKEQWKTLKKIKVSKFESFHRKKSGSVYPVEVFANYIEQNGVELIVGFVEDITKQKEAKESLEKSEKLLRESQEIANIGSWELDLITKNVMCSDQVLKIFEINNSDIFPTFKTFLKIVHPDDRKLVIQAYIKAFTETTAYNFIHRLLINGNIKYIQVYYKTEFNKNGQPVRSIGTIKDITHEYNLTEKIKYISNYDDLTNLPNRVLFYNNLKQKISEIKKHKNRFLGLCFIDLDDFKYINDSYGHSVGDEILKEFSKRLQEEVKNFGWVARFGGDEFAVVLEDVRKPSDVAKILESIVKMMKKPFNIHRKKHPINVSIGISLYPNDTSNIENLIKYSDAAMHRAKEFGKNRYEFYTSDLTKSMTRKMQLMTQLSNAIEKKQFELYYQPQIDLINFKVIGFEALVRWNHPQLGFVSPADFIPIAEENKLIIPLGEWILKEACRQMLKWNNEFNFNGLMAVNVSGIQLDEKAFSQSVSKILKETGVDAKNIEIEITESSFMRDFKHSIQELKKINELGIKLSIDDFGTGYSSLSHLRKMPVETLKIDQSFISDLPDDTDACVIVEAILGLSRSLKVDALAEGIETKEELEFLQKSGCTKGQGYYFSTPLKAADAEAFLIKSIRNN